MTDLDEVDLADLDYDDLDDISDEEWARMEGEAKGEEFRRKEERYDARGGRHEFTDPRACCYRYMLSKYQLERLTSLMAPESLLEASRKRMKRFDPFLTPKVLEMVEANYEQFSQEYRRSSSDDAEESFYDFLHRWAARFGIIPDENSN